MGQYVLAYQLYNYKIIISYHAQCESATNILYKLNLTTSGCTQQWQVAHSSIYLELIGQMVAHGK